MNWLPINDPKDIQTIIDQSYQQTCLIFKHSTRCEISAIAKYRLESDWEDLSFAVQPYFLDLLAHRPISNLIAEQFDVYHESPQVLMIKDGACIFDASHLDISIEELNSIAV